MTKAKPFFSKLFNCMACIKPNSDLNVLENFSKYLKKVSVANSASKIKNKLENCKCTKDPAISLEKC